MERKLALITAVGLLMAGCGSSSKSSSGAGAATTVAAAATAAATTTAAAAATTGAATTAAAATTTAAAATTTAAAAATGANVVTEKEFTIALATPLKSGANELTLTNAGSFPHELKIVKADAFDALPKAADGTIDEATLGAAVVAKSARIAGGASGSLSVTLAAGKYVLICNVGAGANNHAAKGMHMDVTIG